MKFLRPVILSAAMLAGLLATTIPQPSEAAVCPRIYRPVCAVNPAGMLETYPNAICARVAHARILAPGKCLGPICSFIFIPVCAVNPFTGKPETYANLCLAEVGRATLLHKGACK